MSDCHRPSRRRVRPAAVPSPTTSAFFLLVLTAAAVSTFAGNWFLVLRKDSWRAANEVCIRGDPSLLTSCTQQVMHQQSLATLTGPTALLVLAACVYLTRLIWPRASLPGPLEPLPARLSELAAEAGLRHAPTVRTEKGTRQLWTDYRWGRYEIVVPANYPVDAKTKPDTFDPLLRHELGHIVNRDVRRTLFAQATVWVLVLPFATWLEFDATNRSPQLGLNLGWRLVVLLAATWLSLRAILRSREHDADLHAANFDRQAMIDAVAWTRRSRLPRSVAVGWPRWLRWLLGGAAQVWRTGSQLHPSLDQRESVLRSPESVMRLRASESFVAGVAGGVLVVEIGLFTEPFVAGQAFLCYLAAGVLVAFPLVGVVGLAAWRAGVRAASIQERVDGIWVNGVSLAMGLLVGYHLSPRMIADWMRAFPTAPSRGADLSLTTTDRATVVLLVVFLLIACLAFVSWTVAVAKRWTLTNTPREGRPNIGWLLGNGVGVLLLAALLGLWAIAARLATTVRTFHEFLRLYDGPQERAVIAAALAMGWLFLVSVRMVRGLISGNTMVRANRSDGYLRGLRLLPVGIGVLFGVVLPMFLLSGICAPTDRDSDYYVSQLDPIPPTTNTAYACYWINWNAADALKAESEFAAAEIVGRYLAATDDGLLRRYGRDLLKAADTHSRALVSDTGTSVFRRCDLFDRYGY